MDLKHYAIAMAHYNQWMNEKIYACCKQLTEQELKLDRGAFFKSLYGTLSHLYVIDEAWLQRFNGEPVTMKTTRDIPIENFAELKAARVAMDAKILAWAEQITPEFSEHILKIFSISYQKHMRLPMQVAVLQFFNHQTHHRGQITTLLMQMGIDPGVTDLPMLPYFDVQAE